VFDHFGSFWFYKFALNLGDFSTLGLNYLNALALDVFVWHKKYESKFIWQSEKLRRDSLCISFD